MKRGVSGILYQINSGHNADGILCVLLVKRTQNAPRYPGYWSLPGGCVNENESSIETVSREVMEEIGYLVAETPTFHTEVFIQTAPGKHTVEYFGFATKINIRDLKLQTAECEGVGWFSPEEIHHLQIKPEDRIALNNFFSSRGI